MKKEKNKLEWLSRASRWGLAIIFVIAGVPKLLSPDDFAVIISAFGILPDLLVFPVAVLLPLFELITAVGLFCNHRWAIISTLLLYGFFIAILAYGIHLGLDIDCGCFGPEDPEHDVMMGLRNALYRDLLLLLPVVYSVWYMWSKNYNTEKEN